MEIAGISVAASHAFPINIDPFATGRGSLKVFLVSKIGGAREESIGSCVLVLVGLGDLVEVFSRLFGELHGFVKPAFGIEGG